LINNHSDTEPVNQQRGSASDTAEPRFLVIGRVRKPHGVRGEIRVEIISDLPERFNWLDEVYLGQPNPKPFLVESVRFHKNSALLKLKGCDNRDAASHLRSQLVQVPESLGIPLEEDEYYLYQLIGLSVHEEDGNFLGHVAEVIETKANNVFVVKGSKGELLLPDIAEVIREIDFEKGKISVRLLPGMIP
jgi:16S rRNA processing protein RimM